MDTLKCIDGQEVEKAKDNLYLLINALGAYIDIQSMFDALPGGMQFDDLDEIIKKYNEKRAVSLGNTLLCLFKRR